MNLKTKNLLIASIAEFESIDDKDIKNGKINHVKNMLIKNDECIKNLGLGLSSDHVTAGKIFLRLYDKKRLKND